MELHSKYRPSNLQSGNQRPILKNNNINIFSDSNFSNVYAMSPFTEFSQMLIIEAVRLARHNINCLNTQIQTSRTLLSNKQEEYSYAKRSNRLGSNGRQGVIASNISNIERNIKQKTKVLNSVKTLLSEVTDLNGSYNYLPLPIYNKLIVILPIQSSSYKG